MYTISIYIYMYMLGERILMRLFDSHRNVPRACGSHAVITITICIIIDTTTIIYVYIYIYIHTYISYPSRERVDFRWAASLQVGELSQAGTGRGP